MRNRTDTVLRARKLLRIIRESDGGIGAFAIQQVNSVVPTVRAFGWALGIVIKYVIGYVTPSLTVRFFDAR